MVLEEALRMSQPREQSAVKHFRGRWRLLLGAFLVVGTIMAAWLVLSGMFYQSSGVRINRDSFSEINKGMTLTEVEAVFSGPAGEYNTRPIGDPRGATAPPDGSYVRTWIDNHALIEVTFNSNGRVEMKEYYQVSPIDNTWMGYLKTRLGR